MTCKQLAGACDLEFHADTFDEMAQLSQQHGTEMAQKNDEAHLKAMKEMYTLIQSSPDALPQFMAEKKAEFDALPEDN